MSRLQVRWCLVALLSPAVWAACNDERVPGTVDDDAFNIGDDTGGSGDGGSLPDPDGFVDPDGDTDADGGDEDVDPDGGDDVISATCGDGVVDEGEACDDGEENADEADACRTTCESPACGDGIVDTGEACDDGNDDDSDFCASDCTETSGSLCSPCAEDADCGRSVDQCAEFETGSACVTGCDDSRPCPDGFTCTATTGRSTYCVPDSGACVPCVDEDGDGFGIGPECAGLDCDDSNEDIGAPEDEICDGVDNDCDGTIDNSPATGDTVWWQDRDGDGFGNAALTIRACEQPDGYILPTEADCDDREADVNPTAADVCDGIDNDCAAATRDGRDSDEVGTACDGVDSDTCERGAIACVDGALICQGDTADATLELCDGIDNDCDPTTLDGAEEPTLNTACDGPDADRCLGGRTICRDARLVCSGDVVRSEACDGLDNDCDGEIDEQPTADASVWYTDADGDGFGTGEGTRSCPPGDGFVGAAGDCDDTDTGINPRAAEICGDGTDNDCDGGADCADSACAAELECATTDCTVRDIASGVGASVASGSNRTATNTTTGSCGGGGNEVLLEWTAPADGRFVFDTLGSSYNTVLYARNVNCIGPELACNDNIGTGTGAARNNSRITLELSRGQTIVLAVDAVSADAQGAFVLNVTTAEFCDDGIDNDGDAAVDCGDPDCGANPGCLVAGCPDDAIGSAVGIGVYGGSTTGADFNTAGSCGGADSEDVSLSYTAATSATYVFSTRGSEFDTRLYLRESCEGTELACNFVNGTDEAAVSAPLEAGESVVLVVDGQGGQDGNFLVSVRRTEANFCTDGLDNDSEGGIDCADLDCDLDRTCCPTDVFEPNQGTAAAPSTPLATQQANPTAVLTVSAADPDLFNVPVCGGAVVTATARFTHANGNIDMQMLANIGGGTIQIAQANSTDDDESITFTVPDLGPATLERLFVRTTMVDAARCNDYTLTITVNRSGC